MESPLVSIVITSYNRANWIGEAIESALRQDYENLEVIVSDNCSTDNTEQVIKKYLNDTRVKYFKNNKNLGMNGNFKKASEEYSKGRFISFLSSDDFLTYPSFISEAVALIRKYKDMVMVMGKSQDMDNITKSLRKDPTTFYQQEYRSGHTAFLTMANEELSFAGIFLDRPLFLEQGVFDNMDITCFDTLTILNMMQHGSVGYVDQFCYTMRHHGNNIHNQLTAKFFTIELQIINIPYQKAVASKQMSLELLSQWHEKILSRFIKVFFERLYLNNRFEFYKFEQHVSEQYPAVYEKIEADKQWKRYKLMYKFPKITYYPLKAVWRKYKAIRYK